MALTQFRSPADGRYATSGGHRGDDSTQEFIEIRIAQRDPGFPCHRMRLRQKRQRKVAAERRWPMQAFPLAAPLHHQHTVLIVQFRHQIGREAYAANGKDRSEEHTSELQSLMRSSYAVFCLKTKTTEQNSRT